MLAKFRLATEAINYAMLRGGRVIESPESHVYCVVTSTTADFLERQGWTVVR